MTLAACLRHRELTPEDYEFLGAVAWDWGLAVALPEKHPEILATSSFWRVLSLGSFASSMKLFQRGTRLMKARCNYELERHFIT